MHNDGMPHIASLSAIEYSRLYASESGWEFWFGEARRKPMPTQFHGILQALLAHFLRLSGYRASTETELRVVPDWYPRPDVTGVDRKTAVETYPTKPVEVVFEVLSEGEETTEKCRLYASIGVSSVFYFDPEYRIIYEWIDGKLLRVTSVQLANGKSFTGDHLWGMFEKEISESE